MVPLHTVALQVWSGILRASRRDTSRCLSSTGRHRIPSSSSDQLWL